MRNKIAYTIGRENTRGRAFSPGKNAFVYGINCGKRRQKNDNKKINVSNAKRKR